MAGIPLSITVHDSETQFYNYDKETEFNVDGSHLPGHYYFSQYSWQKGHQALTASLSAIKGL